MDDPRCHCESCLAPFVGCPGETCAECEALCVRCSAKDGLCCAECGTYIDECDPDERPPDVLCNACDNAASREDRNDRLYREARA